MEEKSISDIMKMSEAESKEYFREKVFVAEKKGDLGIIRDSLKYLGEKVYVSESNKVMVHTPVDGVTNPYPVYVAYNKQSGMWEGVYKNPYDGERRAIKAVGLGASVFAACAIVNPVLTLRAILGV